MSAYLSSPDWLELGPDMIVINRQIRSVPTKHVCDDSLIEFFISRLNERTHIKGVQYENERRMIRLSCEQTEHHTIIQV